MKYKVPVKAKWEGKTTRKPGDEDKYFLDLEGPSEAHLEMGVKYCSGVRSSLIIDYQLWAYIGEKNSPEDMMIVGTVGCRPSLGRNGSLLKDLAGALDKPGLPEDQDFKKNVIEPIKKCLANA
ncbi:MAG: hypothetical protein AABW79_01610 [Nanoarchaeota archaeon]